VADSSSSRHLSQVGLSGYLTQSKINSLHIFVTEYFKIIFLIDAIT
jgi:hypothetical protein